MSKEDTGTVSFTLDPLNPPTLTPEQHARLAAMRDEDIDLSDIPEQGHKTGWVRGNLKERIAQRIAERAARDAAAQALFSTQEKILELDEDVIDLFKEVEDGSPEKMNAVLREYAVAHRKSA